MQDKEILDKIISIIQKNRGELSTVISLNSSLQRDLGIDGADAEDVINGFFDEFAIDATDFYFTDYFGEEAFDLLGFLKRKIRGKKYKNLTIEKLLESAKKGIWIRD